jgi:hypothetical protein
VKTTTWTTIDTPMISRFTSQYLQIYFSNMSMKLTLCLYDIREWMCLNLLEMNQDKTELIIFAPKRRAKELTDISISLGGNIIHDTTYVNKSTAHRCWTLDFFVSDIKLQAIYKVIHTSNLSTDWGQHFLQVY